MYSLLGNSDLLGVDVYGPLGYDNYHQEDTSHTNDLHTVSIGSYLIADDQFSDGDIVYNETSSPYGYHSSIFDSVVETGNSHEVLGPSLFDYLFGQTTDQFHFGSSGGYGWSDNYASQSHEVQSGETYVSGGNYYRSYSDTLNTLVTEHYASYGGTFDSLSAGQTHQWSLTVGHPGYTETWSHLDSTTHTITYNSSPAYGGKG